MLAQAVMDAEQIDRESHESDRRVLRTSNDKALRKHRGPSSQSLENQIGSTI